MLGAVTPAGLLRGQAEKSNSAPRLGAPRPPPGGAPLGIATWPANGTRSHPAP